MVHKHVGLNDEALAARRMRYVLLTLFVAIFIAVVVIASGVFDPPLPECSVAMLSVAMHVDSGSEAQTIWLEPLAKSAQGVRMTGTWLDGESDAGYGALLGSPDAYIGVAVSPLGYATVWRVTAGETTVLMPWQPWPHVRHGAAANEFWFDWRAEDVTIRLNREIVGQWAFENETVKPANQPGLWATLYGATAGAAAHISFTDQFSDVNCPVGN